MTQRLISRPVKNRHSSQLQNSLYNFKKPLDEEANSNDYTISPTISFNTHRESQTRPNRNHHFYQNFNLSNSHFTISKLNSPKPFRYIDQSSSKSKLPNLTISVLFLIAIFTSRISLSFGVISSNMTQTCPDGFKLTTKSSSESASFDTTFCEDINECESTQLNSCDQHCHNTLGSYTCHCYPGFNLERDGFSCKSSEQTKFLISSNNKIYSVSMDGKSKPKSEMVLEAKSRIVSFSGDAASHKIYYIEEEDGLWVFDTDSRQKHRNITRENTSGVIKKAKLSFDWTKSSLLMAIDLRIVKFENLIENRSFYISDHLQHIGDLFIDPIGKLIYITEMGAKSQLIILDRDTGQRLHEFSDLTNKYLQTKLRVSHNIYDSVIYLTNSEGTLFSCSVSKSATQKLRLNCRTESVNETITSQAVHSGSSLFFLNDNNSIIRCNMRNCSGEFETYDLDFEPNEIVLWSSSAQLQPEEVTCNQCSHGCSRIDTWFSQCLCEAGFELAEDGKTCTDIDECEQSTSQCEELCTNTEGGFECSCYNSNTRLKSDGKSCETFMTSCDQNVCSHQCAIEEETSKVTKQKSQVAKCLCPVGSHLMGDKQTCTGCRAGDNGGCSHSCVETGIDSFVCSCPNGFDLDKDGKTCKLNEQNLRIIGATESDMKIFELPNMNVLKTINIGGILDMTMDPEHNSVYFISDQEKMIGKVNLTDFEQTKLVETTGHSFTSITIDWYYDTIYTSDSTTGAIYSFRVSDDSKEDLPKKLRPRLTNLTNPRDLTIDSDMGDMYFMAEESQMSDNKTLTKLMQWDIKRNVLLDLIYTSNGTGSLHVDYLSQQLFFTNMYSGEINSININPYTKNNSIYVSTTNDNAFMDNIQIADDKIYALDPERRWKIVTYSKTSGKKLKNLSKNKRNQIGNLNKFLIFHSSGPLNNERSEFGVCSQDNGGCDHKCNDDLVPEFGMKISMCSCYENFTLAEDLRTCLTERESKGASEDYDETSQILPSENCSRKGLFCHHDADCVRNFQGLLQCHCKEGFEGHGIRSCQKKKIACTRAEQETAACEFGTCYVDTIVGKRMALCQCFQGRYGKRCDRTTGKRRRLHAPQEVEHSRITALQMFQIGLLTSTITLFALLFLSILVYRHKKRRKMQKLRRRQSSVGIIHYNCEVAAQQGTLRSPVTYSEIACGTPTDETCTSKSEALQSPNAAPARWETTSKSSPFKPNPFVNSMSHHSILDSNIVCFPTNTAQPSRITPNRFFGKEAARSSNPNSSNSSTTLFRSLSSMGLGLGSARRTHLSDIKFQNGLLIS